MKISYLGQDITPRKSNGQFTRKWRKTKIAALLSLIGILSLAFYGEQWVGKELKASNIPESIVSVAHADTTMEGKIDAWKEEILDRLAACESGGKKEEDGITILDSNNVGSYGAFQFQRKTVMHYHEARTGNEINGRDAIILAMTPDKARDLARWIIFETDNGVGKDWVLCSRKHDLQKEVTLIKALLAK